MEGGKLHIERKRRGETVEVIGLRMPSFGFDKKLVVILVGKAVNLVFDTWMRPVNIGEREKPVRRISWVRRLVLAI